MRMTLKNILNLKQGIDMFVIPDESLWVIKGQKENLCGEFLFMRHGEKNKNIYIRNQ